eukprot:TRINITY_DN13366_c0_g1_i3.p1 TRINITY_DN13366_c0_g1~~TRINITY_DN13366_c0_g1_i3.p1  ORF type:complete len:424 (-),score=74.65 TRINITY_DN13366_c0_g1_i3:264-1499(-)
MANFDFLKDSWGIALHDKGKEEIKSYAESTSRSCIEDYIKDSDVRKLGVESTLPKDIGRLSGTLPPGKYLVQIIRTADITQPAKFQEEFEGGKWRLLVVDLTDGTQKFKGIEYLPLNHRDFSVQVPPGTKLLLESSAKAPIYARNGHLLLGDNNVWNLGGNVEKLVESWRASREVEESRLLWRTEGVKKKDKSEDSAPAWQDFDPKKAPKGLDAWRKEAKELRDAWAKCTGVTAAAAAQRSRAADDDETKGPRFQVQEFKDADFVQSTVTSSAFKQQESSKGKKGKGKGDDGAGPRRGRRGADDYEEEKRAPTGAVSSLAAFIKPTKDGALPDAALDLQAEPAKHKEKSGGAYGGDSSWDASGWGSSDWGDSGWGSSSWGGGGWSSGGGGRKSGGKKSGGKGGGGGKGKRR